MFPIPFVIASFGVCMLSLFRSRKPLYVRILPLIFLGSFSSIYNYHIGQYGVYKHIDGFYAFLTAKEETEVGRQAKEFLVKIEEEVEKEVERRRELRRKRREAEEGSLNIAAGVKASVAGATEGKKGSEAWGNKKEEGDEEKRGMFRRKKKEEDKDKEEMNTDEVPKEEIREEAKK